jgi:hypothetical protein
VLDIDERTDDDELLCDEDMLLRASNELEEEEGLMMTSLSLQPMRGGIQGGSVSIRFVEETYYCHKT